MTSSVIYKILLANGDFYVGSAVNYSRRVNQHNCNLRKNNHHNFKIQRYYNKYGPENISFHIIEELPDNNELLIKEQYYIDLLKPTLNICKIAGNCLGRIVSEKSRAKLSQTLKGKTPWNKGLSGFKAWNKGKKITEETRIKLIKSHLGQKNPPISDLTRKKIKEARIKQSPPTLGMNLPKSEAHKAQISKTLRDYFQKNGCHNIGRKASPETIERLKKSHLGKPSFWKGKKLSPEAIAKRTATRKKNKELKKAA